MIKTELLIELYKLKAEEKLKPSENNWRSAEERHKEADELLLKYINDKEIKRAFLNIKRYWYD